MVHAHQSHQRLRKKVSISKCTLLQAVLPDSPLKREQILSLLGPAAYTSLNGHLSIEWANCSPTIPPLGRAVAIKLLMEA